MEGIGPFPARELGEEGGRSSSKSFQDGAQDTPAQSHPPSRQGRPRKTTWPVAHAHSGDPTTCFSGRCSMETWAIWVHSIAVGSEPRQAATAQPREVEKPRVNAADRMQSRISLGAVIRTSWPRGRSETPTGKQRPLEGLRPPCSPRPLLHTNRLSIRRPGTR